MDREIFEKIGAILAVQVGLDPHDLRSESSLESFGVDSFDIAEFSFHVEDEFGVNIDDYFSSHGPGQPGSAISFRRSRRFRNCSAPLWSSLARHRRPYRLDQAVH